MFEIFGALFGGTYISSAIRHEKKVEREWKDKREKYEKVRSKLTNSYLEYQMRRDMSYPYRGSDEEYHRSKQTKEKMVSEVNEEDLVDVFGYNWREILDKASSSYLPRELLAAYPECFQHIYEVVFNIWLSQKGYIADWHTNHGYSAQLILKGMDESTSELLSSGITMSAVRIIERNIRAKYPEYWIVDETDKKPVRKMWNFSQKM